MGLVKKLFGLIIGITISIIALIILNVFIPNVVQNLIVILIYFSNFFTFMFLIVGSLIGLSSVSKYARANKRFLKVIFALLSFNFVRVYDLITGKIVLVSLGAKPISQDFSDYDY